MTSHPFLFVSSVSSLFVRILKQIDVECTEL